MVEEECDQGPRDGAIYYSMYRLHDGLAELAAYTAR